MRDVSIRPARGADAAAIAAIHTQGIEDRVATFRTEPRSADEVGEALANDRPALVAERDGDVVGWAVVGPYEDQALYYAGVGEATLYVERAARGGGVGALLLRALERAAAEAGFHKLIAKVFDTNEASVNLFARAGWRTVGTHRRHGQLDDEWKDVALLERSLPRQADD